MKYASNERGALSLLVVILVVALVGVVGMAVYNAKKASQKAAQTANPASASPGSSPAAAARPAVDETASWPVFKDKNATVSIKYPTNWVLDPETINNYASFEAATNQAAAHFRVNSTAKFPELKAQDYRAYADGLAKELSMEVMLFRGVNVTVEEWLKSKQVIKTSSSGIEPFGNDITKVEDLTINGKPAKKVYRGSNVTYSPYGPKGKSVTVIYVDNGKAAIFTAGPYNSRYVDEPFNKIVQTFKFL